MRLALGLAATRRLCRLARHFKEPFFLDLDLGSEPAKEATDIKDTKWANEPTGLDLMFAEISKGTGTSEEIEKEKQLFERILDSYAQKHTEQTRLQRVHDEMLTNFQQSLFANEKPKKQPLGFDRVAHGLAPTFEYADLIELKLELLNFVRGFLLRTSPNEAFYLHRGEQELKSEHEARLSDMSSHVRRCSEQDPPNFVVNAYTLPLVFNRCLNAATRLRDGQLALSIFNSVKKDLGLYSVACNQQTHNSVLRIIWEYHGKRSLYEVEMAFTEMVNSGFEGDMKTHDIVMEIVAGYKGLQRAGVWAREDDKRVVNLERLAKTVALRFGRQRLFSTFLNE